MPTAPIVLTISEEEDPVPYLEALRAVGVPEERLRVIRPEDPDAPALAAGAAGIVLCGGDDVVPSRFGEEALPGARLKPVPRRDELEWAVLDAARERRVPVWGICRGIQVLNVYFGGTLWQDIPTQCPGAVEHAVSQPRDALVHRLRVTAPEHPFGARVAETGTLVNSRHHQAVRRLAAGLVAVAETEDGLVEAAALSPAGGHEGWWVRSVQWHPENLVALAGQRDLWNDFARAAGEHRGENR
jgi:putative glutamine amidotransferase